MSAEQVTARVGGDLTIQSVQDTATYDSRHQSAGGSVTIGYGFAASASYSNARVEADHASVSQHSGLRAGDQGFQVEVKGHTELQGGLIASTQAAVDAGRNRLVTGSLSTQDITNRSEHDARGISLSGGFSYGGSGKQGSSDGAGTNSPGSTSAPASPSSGVALQQFQTGSQGVAAGYVSDSSHRSSTTRSGISGGELVITDAAAQQERTGQSIEETLASVNRNVLSGTGANELTQRWDGQQLQQQVQAGAQIVATFGRQASKAVGDYAGRKAAELRAQDNEEEAKKWDEGGAYRVAAHIAVGGLSGGLEGALGSGSSAAAVPHLAEAINAAGLPEPVRQAVIAAAGTAVGALTGGTTGAATGFNQTANNYLLHEEQLARSQADQACRSGDAQACQTRERLDQLSQTRQAELSHSCLDGSAAQCRANLSLLSQDYLALQASAQDLAARIAASTDPREVEALKALQKQNQTHLRQVAGLLKTNLGEIDQNKGGLTPAEKIVLASIHADTSGREITEALIGAAILGKKAADRLSAVGSATGDKTSTPLDSASPALTRDQAIDINAQRDADLTTPVVSGAPGEQIRNLVNTTAQHPSDWTVQIGGRTLTPDPALSKNQPVYSGVSDAEVLNFVNSITGGAQPTATFNVRNGTGQSWVLPDGSKVTLRSDARSSQQLGPHWTVEIESASVYHKKPGKAVEFKFLR